MQKMTLKTKLVQDYLKLFLPSFLLVAIYLYIKIEMASIVPHFCLIEEVVNLKCPFCGLTKAFFLLLNGEYKLALINNTLSFFLPFYLIINQVYKYAKFYRTMIVLEFYFTIIIILQFIISNY